MGTDPVAHLVNSTGVTVWLTGLYQAHPTIFLAVCGVIAFLGVQMIFREDAHTTSERPAARERRNPDYY